MKILSYKTNPDKRDGHWTFWRDGISIALAKNLAAVLGAELVYEIVLYGGGAVRVKEEGDIAFIPFGWYPDKRPAEFIYTFCSDATNDYRLNMLKWMDTVRPNLIGCLQYKPVWLKIWGCRNDCVVTMLPWFVIDEPEVSWEPEDRDILVMCSGAVGASYPTRTRIAEYLLTHYGDRKDVIVSCGPFGKYKLDDKQYRDALKRTRYYVTAGIHDMLIPPKYYEVCNNGCCLVSPFMDNLRLAGWEHNKDYVVYTGPEDFTWILESAPSPAQWQYAGPRGMRMVRQNHSVKRRAENIAHIYRVWQESEERAKQSKGGA